MNLPAIFSAHQHPEGSAVTMGTLESWCGVGSHESSGRLVWIGWSNSAAGAGTPDPLKP